MWSVNLRRNSWPIKETCFFLAQSLKSLQRNVTVSLLTSMSRWLEMAILPESGQDNIRKILNYRLKELTDKVDN